MKISDIPALREAFGTYKAAADVLDMSPQALNDAKNRGTLPKHSFIAQKAALEAEGHECALSLWGFEEPASPAMAAE